MYYPNILYKLRNTLRNETVISIQIVRLPEHLKVFRMICLRLKLQMKAYSNGAGALKFFEPYKSKCNMYNTTFYKKKISEHASWAVYTQRSLSPGAKTNVLLIGI